MGSIELDPYARRVATLCETCPPASRSETTSWVLWPLLAALGWKFEQVRPGASLGLLETDLVLSVRSDPSTPALIVAGEASTAELSPDRIETIAETMAASGIDRALYANGRDFLFLAGTGADRLRVSATDLPSRLDEIRLYSRDSLRSYCATLDPANRSSRRLAISREELADSIRTLLDDALGPAGSPAERTLTEFLDTVGDRTKGQTESPARPAATTAADRSDDNPEDAETASAPSPQQDAGERETASYPHSVAPDGDPDGEYVARIFNERGSIGAVGHSTSAGALAQAAAYFFERGLSGIRIPWAPEDGAIVINDEPVDAAGNRWAAYERLGDGLYVKTSGSVAERASRLQALADRAGLRVMLTGDWSRKAG